MRVKPLCPRLRVRGMTKPSRRLHLLLPLVLCASLVTPAFAASAPTSSREPSPGPQLLEVQLSETAVTISGLGVSDVLVRVHLAAPAGITTIPETPESDPVPNVRFERTAKGRGHGGVTVDRFTLSSGTTEDGWWQAVAHLTSGLDGTMTVAQVCARAADGQVLTIDPRIISIDAHLQVTGRHIPLFTIGQAPDPATNGQNVTFFGTLTDSDTGAPFAGVNAGANFDSVCLVSGAYGGVATTTSGSWRETYPNWQWGGSYGCAGASGVLPVTPPGDGGVLVYAYADDGHRGGFNPDFREWVTARAAAPSTRVGATVVITGRSSALGLPVNLQRLVGRTWRTVGTTVVRYSGRFALLAQPPASGTFHYRVLRPATRYHEFPATAPPMTLVALAKE